MRILLTIVFVIRILECSAQSQPMSFSVYFGKGSAELNPADALTIADFMALTRDSSYNAIFLKGYADPDGSDADNMTLSEQRVSSVINQFNGRKYAIETQFYGEHGAVNKNNTEAEKALNRRVDIILWTDYSLFNKNKKPQVFTVAANKKIMITGAEGTKITIPASSLVYENGDTPLGDITIELTEYYTMLDIMQQKLTTTANGQMLESAGMINIEATRNDKKLRLKGGALMEVQFAERENNDGFGLFYGDENPRTQTVNWTPAVNPSAIDKVWNISGCKLFVSDTIEKWRSKFDYNNYGQRIRVTERWEENKGISYDTLIIDKTINANKIILQSTRMGWINCDQFYDIKTPTTQLYVDAGTLFKSEVVLIFTERKGMILPIDNGQGQLIFSNVPVGQKVVITGIGSQEGKLFFAKQDFTTASTTIKLDFKETAIADIQAGLANLN